MNDFVKTQLVFLMLMNTVYGYHYSNVDNIKDQLCLTKAQYENHNSSSECGVKCLEDSYAPKSLCAAFKFDKITLRCSTCLTCGGDMSAVTPSGSADFAFFLFFPNYNVTLMKGLLLFYDFESVPAAVTLDGSPTLIAGKNGTGISFANANDATGHALTFSGPGTECMVDLSLCEVGMTMAFWHKMHLSPNGGYPNTMRSKALSVGCRSDGASRSGCWYRFSNIPRNKDYMVVSPKSFPINTWYHYVMTYKHGVGFSAYVDGCLVETITDAQATAFTAPAANVEPLSSTLGCTLRTAGLRMCGNEEIDDFYLWKDQKSDLFAWQLYNNYR